MSNLLAKDLGTFSGIGGISNTPATSSITGFTKVVSTAVGLLTIIAGLYFLFRLLTAAFKWIGAGGNKDTLAAAQKAITSALTGLIIVILSYALTGLVGVILGFDILNLTPLITG